jgi:hypothetical protein
MSRDYIEVLPDLSAMATPVVFAQDLPALVGYYTGVLRFRLVQQVRHVVALLESGPLRLQLWQRTGQRPRLCRVRLHSPHCIFTVHASLARHARSAMVEAGPTLQPWGTWEFSMFDSQGNQLVFVECADA